MIDDVKIFVEQSQRVIAITYKPRNEEYKQMAYTTAIGMAAIGLAGLAIATASVFLKNR